MTEEIRQLLIRADSMLSLLRYRCERTIPWGTVGLPEMRDVEAVIGALRAAYEETKTPRRK